MMSCCCCCCGEPNSVHPQKMADTVEGQGRGDVIVKEPSPIRQRMAAYRTVTLQNEV